MTLGNATCKPVGESCCHLEMTHGQRGKSSTPPTCPLSTSKHYREALGCQLLSYILGQRDKHHRTQEARSPAGALLEAPVSNRTQRGGETERRLLLPQKPTNKEGRGRGDQGHHVTYFCILGSPGPLKRCAKPYKRPCLLGRNHFPLQLG